MFTLNRKTVILIAMIGLIGLYAWLEHQSHVLEYRNYIFFALFIGLHLLMHAGHGHGHGHGSDKKQHNENNIT